MLRPGDTTASLTQSHRASARRFVRFRQDWRRQGQGIPDPHCRKDETGFFHAGNSGRAVGRPRLVGSPTLAIATMGGAPGRNRVAILIVNLMADLLCGKLPEHPPANLPNVDSSI